MVGQATYRIMEDGKRLHLQHGPIDIVAEGFGGKSEVFACYQQGIAVFETVLQTLVMDLDVLKEPVDQDRKQRLQGIAGNMYGAAARFAGNRFVTPMAAVAGAVADFVKNAMLEGRSLEKLYVNNGGDISLYLNGQASFTSAIVNNQDAPSVDAKITIRPEEGIGGIATSGWRGRSLSPGIADAVTVLAETTALADVAATLIAGDVWVDSVNVEQQRASSLREDTDLGDMMVTTDVGRLQKQEIEAALNRGLVTAERFRDLGLIKGAYLALQGEVKSLPLVKT